MHYVNISRNGVYEGYEIESPSKNFISTSNDPKLSTSQRKQQQHCNRLYLQGKAKLAAQRLKTSKSQTSFDSGFGSQSNQKLSKDQIEKFYARIMNFSAAKERAVKEQKELKEQELEKSIQKPCKFLALLLFRKEALSGLPSGVFLKAQPGRGETQTGPDACGVVPTDQVRRRKKKAVQTQHFPDSSLRFFFQK